MNESRIASVIIAPIMSEKASILADTQQQYVFKVLPNASKLEVAKAVEMFFSVKVKSVAVLNVKGKTRRTRKGLGRTNNWKKAYVSLHEGHEISFSATDKSQEESL